MMKWGTKAAATVAALAASLLMPAFSNGQGEHRGERRQIEATISFSGQAGHTVVDGEGTHYHVGRWVFSEPKVYDPAYWGTYPLYFFGRTVGVTVALTNHGPRRKAKVRVRTEAYVLHTDGTSGVALTDPREVEVEVARGTTQHLDASFIGEFRPGAESGLDRFLVKVSHPNQGGGPGNDEPALILVAEGIFCPPEIQARIESGEE